jgi:hypothetical protein
MSLNVCFEAVREIRVLKTGRKDIQRTVYEVWQTPTKVTQRIVGSQDPIQEYRNWVSEQVGCVTEEDTYAPDDLFCENPTGKEIFDPRVGHLEDLAAWVREMQKGGWTIKAAAG